MMSVESLISFHEDVIKDGKNGIGNDDEKDAGDDGAGGGNAHGAGTLAGLHAAQTADGRNDDAEDEAFGGVQEDVAEMHAGGKLVEDEGRGKADADGDQNTA